MSTRSIIASDDLQLGRYCHSDGYPAYNGCQLCRIIQRDGVDAAISNLVEKHDSWSFLDTEFTQKEFDERCDNKYCDTSRLGFLEGYGVYFTGDDAMGNQWNGIVDKPWGYVIKSDGIIEVYHSGDLVGEVNALSPKAEEKMRDIDESVYGD